MFFEIILCMLGKVRVCDKQWIEPIPAQVF